MVQTLKQGSFSRDYNSGGNADQNDTCIPRFYMEAEQIMQDGIPVYRDVEMVEVIMPGNALTKPCQIVTDFQRNRWPKQYAAFKANEEMPVEGTPLEQWPILTRSMVLTLKSLEFRTVEDLSKMGEHAIQKIGMGGRELKKMAAAYIDDSQRMAITNKAIEDAAKFERRAAELETQVSRLNEQLAIYGEQMRMMQQQQQMTQQNIASTPNVVQFQAQAYQQQPASPFAAFAKSGQQKADDRREELSQFTAHDVRAPSLPPAETVELQVPARKRGRKSNAEKAAEAAARGD